MGAAAEVFCRIPQEIFEAKHGQVKSIQESAKQGMAEAKETKGQVDLEAARFFSAERWSKKVMAFMEKAVMSNGQINKKGNN